MIPVVATGLIDIGKSLIDKLISDPDAKEKANNDLIAMQLNGQLKEVEASMGAIIAEANSSDPWTSRARPSFMYVFYLLIFALTIVAPIIGVFKPNVMELFFVNVSKGFQAIPEAMWWTFSAGYLGYSTSRTVEKVRGVSK